jgi:hypothetical protein
MSLRESVDAALAADTIDDADQGVVALVRLYADTIDDDLGAVKDLGPKLLAALEALQLSPRARALARIHRLGETGGSSGAAGKPAGLDELRARRHRKSRA